MLISNLMFEFTEYTAFTSFCRLQSSEWRNNITSISLQHLEGYSNFPLEDPNAILNDAFPKLRIVHLSLQPRDPRRLRLADWEWGPQTKKFLKNIAHVKGKVSLELRWLHDCERFEREYVGEKGWEIVEKIEVANEKSWRASAMQRMPGMCFRVCELH